MRLLMLPVTRIGRDFLLLSILFLAGTIVTGVMAGNSPAGGELEFAWAMVSLSMISISGTLAFASVLVEIRYLQATKAIR